MPPEPTPPHPRRLAAESSPYLRQHADNPVDWMPWGPEAFERARTLDRPIFLSVGYSTCHWCHVMARESFEDPGIAAVLNACFVSIKVDREERPDVDRLYMTFVQATTGHGGWPMSVWLTPTLRPFYGGTYYPPTGRQGRPGFMDVLRGIASAWARQRDRLTAEGDRVLDQLRAYSLNRINPAAAGLEEADLDRAREELERLHDPIEGGFGDAPKFPRPCNLDLLARLALRGPADAPGRSTSLRLLTHTLDRLAAGGIHDHLGGGFHRYAVDAAWHVPHFEKMLYDQAQLASVFLDAAQLTRRREYAQVARTTLEYVRRDLRRETGGYAGAEDADSDRPEGGGHAEGAYYVWTQDELRQALGPSLSPVFEYAYGISADGNAPPGSDPQGELARRNVLKRFHSDAATASALGLAHPADAASMLADARTRLEAVRRRRPRPHRDDKVITAWNGLLLSAFARAAQVLGDEAEATAARDLADWLQREHRDPRSGRLWRCRRDPGPPIPAFAEDHAALTQGLLDLYETTLETRWLKWAVELDQALTRDFHDEEGGGFFHAPADATDLALRLKEDYDGAEPSANSLAALNSLRLGHLLGREDRRSLGERTLATFAAQWRHSPQTLPRMLVAGDFALGPVSQVVLAGEVDDPELRQLLRTVHGLPLFRRVILHLPPAGPEREALAATAPWIRSLPDSGTRATAYVCHDGACQLPTSSPVELLRHLRGMA